MTMRDDQKCYEKNKLKSFQGVKADVFFRLVANHSILLLKKFQNELPRIVKFIKFKNILLSVDQKYP